MANPARSAADAQIRGQSIVVMKSAKHGLLIVGHGTRDQAGLDGFAALVELIRAKTDAAVEPCFLELARPSIAEGLARLVELGAKRITVTPLLLFAAGHAKHDIPAAVADAVAQRPNLTVDQAATLESHERVLELSARRFREAIASNSSADPLDTMLVMVGRGSHDAEATAAMHRFAQLRAQRTRVGRVLVCFLAMQRPSLAETLAEAAASNFARIVVQPHLLFHGLLYDEIQTTVEENRRRSPKEWIVTSVLGPELEVAQAVIDLVERSSMASSPRAIIG